MSDTIAAITERRDRLANLRRQLQAKLSKVEAELNDMDVALSVIAKVSGVDVTPKTAPTGSVGSSNSKAARVIEIVKGYWPQAVSQQEIAEKYEQTYGQPIEGNTVRVSLLRAKSRNIVRNDGATWIFLGNEENPAGTAANEPPPANSIFD